MLVTEIIDENTGKGENIIKRSDIVDNWSLDNNIEEKNTLTFKKDYDIYEYYGWSVGHNAPAFYHKHNLDDYYETFLISNITPQHISLNIGIWSLLENWCKLLQNNKKLKNIYIFTGSIVNTSNSILFNSNLDKSIINIPTKMFKIVCFNHINYPDITFMNIFMFNNKSYVLDIEKKVYNLTNYLLPINSYKWFENTTGINISNLFKYYNINTDNLKSFKHILNLNLKLSMKLHQLVIKSNIYDSIVSSKTLQELYNNLNKNKKYFKDTDLNFIYTFFYKIRNKIIRDNILYTNLKTLKQFDKFFNTYKNNLNTKYIVDEQTEVKFINLTQTEYLNKYYNIVKNKLEK